MNQSKKYSRPLSFSTVLFSILLLSITACSHVKSTSEPVEFNDDIKGPGFFSGSKGGFYLFNKDTDKKNRPNHNANTRQIKPVNEMSLKESSEELEERIQQLERDKIELELLKRRIDKKLAE